MNKAHVICLAFLVQQAYAQDSHTTCQQIGSNVNCDTHQNSGIYNFAGGLDTQNPLVKAQQYQQTALQNRLLQQQIEQQRILNDQLRQQAMQQPQSSIPPQTQGVALTVGDYQGRLHNAQGTWIFIAGAYTAYLFANSALHNAGRPMLYCQPEHLTLDDDDMKAMLDKTAKVFWQSDDAKNLPMSAGILIALQYTFPCPAEPIAAQPATKPRQRKVH